MLQVYLEVEERGLVLLPDVTPSPLHSFPLSLHPGGWKSEASFPSLVLTAVPPAGLPGPGVIPQLSTPGPMRCMK